MHFVIQSIKDLFKADIRLLARSLGLSEEITNRMPFPGPGLAIRMAEPVTQERVELVRWATKIVEDILLPLNPFQCLVFLMAGQATTKRPSGAFGSIIAVRCVDSEDSGQTATATVMHQEIEEKITEELMSVPQIARVVFDKTPKPPGRIEYM